jgi:medium-chain acyl-[acyl-carrier-protein] hydrolase
MATSSLNLTSLGLAPAWVPLTTPAAPSLRLLCFHSAGGMASQFRDWKSLLPSHFVTSALQLPGRENRIGEPPFVEMRQAVEHIVDNLPSDGTATAFFGYSLGALIAFETIRELRRRGRKLPVQLFVAGSIAPHSDHRRTPSIAELSDDDLLNEIRRSGSVPEIILRDQGVMRAIYPMVRADFRLLESYQAVPEEPLDIPVVAYGAITDPFVPMYQLAGWSGDTEGRFRMRFFQGDHYFVRTAVKELLADVVNELSLLTARDSV